MNKQTMELAFILDRSGSMYPLVSDTLGGFNSLLERQKKKEGNCLVSTWLFNGSATLLYERVPIKSVSEMTPEVYVPGGCTALLDAIGEAIEHISALHRHARAEDLPEKTMFVIITDGMENASQYYNGCRVQELIGEGQARGWEFLFLGADSAAIEDACRWGIHPASTAAYRRDSRGTETLFRSVDKAIRSVREESRLSPDWNAELAER